MSARILVIEDDIASRELMKYLLGHAGHVVLSADDGAEGLRLALEQEPDLIVCDLQMPVLDGLGVVQALRGHEGWRRVPLIALTASSMTGDREIALAAGFADHIPKPIEPKLIVSQLESFLPMELRAPRHTDGACDGQDPRR